MSIGLIGSIEVLEHPASAPTDVQPPPRLLGTVWDKLLHTQTQAVLLLFVAGNDAIMRPALKLESVI